MHVHVDQAGGDDQPMRVNFFNFGFRSLNFGFGRDDFFISDINVGKFIPFIRGIDHATVANDRGVHVRGAHACSVLVAAFCGGELLPHLFDAPVLLEPCREVREGRMPSPARRMRALPRVDDRRLIKMQMRRE